MKAPTPLPEDSPISPDCLVLLTGDDVNTQQAALVALHQARRIMPKLTGWSSSRLMPIWGDGWFGIRWLDRYVWFVEHGTRGRTMKSLAGKTIPMWIDDPTGEMRAKNPKNKTRTSRSGKTQVLIFRRAAAFGQRKTVKRKVAGQVVDVSVPASYPGAPGRIVSREAASPWTATGKVGGAIRAGNVGVRWYNPGISARYMLAHSLGETTRRLGIHQGPIYAAVAA
jgi:hypothetical protein